jgi:ADP-ribose pyrophosphatase YjhB (NUDIX family)
MGSADGGEAARQEAVRPDMARQEGVQPDMVRRDPTRPVVACVGAVVHDAAGRLLMIRRGHAPSRGLWSLPGGRVEPGETPAEAVAREVREETGLAVVAGEPVGRVLIPAAEVDYDVVDFACSLADPAPEPVAGDDAEAVVFADAGTLDGLACTPRLVETLRNWGVLPA